MYGMRWLRLLFLREFRMEDCLFLWDALFADLCVAGSLGEARPIGHLERASGSVC